MSQSVEIILIQGQINFLVVSLNSSIQQGQSSPILVLSTLLLWIAWVWSKCVPALSSGCRVNLRRPCSSVKGRTTMRPVKASWQLPLIQLDRWEHAAALTGSRSSKLHICPTEPIREPAKRLICPPILFEVAIFCPSSVLLPQPFNRYGATNALPWPYTGFHLTAIVGP